MPDTPAHPTRRRLLGGVAASLGAGAWVLPARAQRARDAATPAPQALTIQSERLATFARSGSETPLRRLAFRGGLVLASAHKDFGGWSGITVAPDGRRLLAISDEGHWLTGEIIYDGTRPSGIVRAEIGPLLAQNGRPLAKKRDADAEAVALLDGNLTNGTVLIGFERNHRVGRFPIIGGRLQPPTGYLPLPPEARRMPSNKGFEAVAVMGGGPLKGSPVAIAERFPDANGHHSGWIWVRGVPQRFALTNIGEFDITDAAALPDGAVLILERRFRWLEGVKMQMRYLKPGLLVPGAVIEGEVLVTADMTSQIDNMEGLAVSTGPAGETVLTLISDDNYNHILQRTVLLQFTFKPDGAQKV